MHSYTLSWTFGVGEACKGGHIKNPKWSDIEEKLLSLQRGQGSVGLEMISGPDIGPQNLQVEADDGHYLLSLGEDDGEDYIVRTLDNPKCDEYQVGILGNLYSSRQICRDVGLVIRAFDEFFSSGDVSRDFLV